MPGQGGEPGGQPRQAPARHGSGWVHWRLRGRGWTLRPCRTRRSSRRGSFRCSPAACRSWAGPLGSGCGSGSGERRGSGARLRAGGRVDVGREGGREGAGPGDRQGPGRQASRRAGGAARRRRLGRLGSQRVDAAAMAPTAPTSPTTSSRSASPAAYVSWARSRARETRSSLARYAVSSAAACGTGPSARTLGMARCGAGVIASTQARSRARMAAARASSSSTCCWVRTRLRAAEARSAAATMRSRSSTATSISSGPDDAADVGAATGALDEVVHATVEPRELLGGLVALRAGRDERDLVARALDPCAHQGDSLGRLGGPGREGGARLEGAGQRVEQPARLGQADGERAARRQREVLGGVGVEPSVDRGSRAARPRRDRRGRRRRSSRAGSGGR